MSWGKLGFAGDGSPPKEKKQFLGNKFSKGERMKLKIIVMSVMLLLLAVSARAATLDLGSATGVAAGSQVTLPITLTNTAGVNLAGLGMDIGFDATKFSVAMDPLDPTTPIAAVAGP